MKYILLFTLILQTTVLPADSYDDYQKYKQQTERPAIQQTTYQTVSYFNPSSALINTRSEFLNNRDYAPLIALARFDHQLQNFLQEKVAPNIKIADYAGYTPSEETRWDSYSNLSGRYENQTFTRIKKTETGYRSLEISIERSLGPVKEKVDQIVYGDNNLPKSLRVSSTDLVGNTYVQTLSNLL